MICKIFLCSLRETSRKSSSNDWPYARSHLRSHEEEVNRQRGLKISKRWQQHQLFEPTSRKGQPSCVTFSRSMIDVRKDPSFLPDVSLLIDRDRFRRARAKNKTGGALSLSPSLLREKEIRLVSLCSSLFFFLSKPWTTEVIMLERSFSKGIRIAPERS